ncbi:MAG: sensor histidine kinase [Acidobacteriota bacterium]
MLERYNRGADHNKMAKMGSQDQSPASTEAEGAARGHPWEFLRAALEPAQRHAPLGSLLSDLCLKLSEHHPFDSTEIWTKACGREIGCCLVRPLGPGTSAGVTVCSDESESSLKQRREFYEQLRQGQAVVGAFRTPSGAVWARSSLVSRDPTVPQGQRYFAERAACGPDAKEPRKYELLILLPFAERHEGGGLLVLRDRQFSEPDPAELSRLELLAESLGIALAVRKTQAALTERIKELTCLYNLALLAEAPGANLEDLLKGVVELLPNAVLYPEDARARIELDGVCYGPGVQEGAGSSLRAPIIVLGVRRGSIEVTYRTPKPPLDQGPFLREEKSLLDTVAREVALLVERKQREAESRALEEQLRHADRLATIGELAAGVAHELNEPLANILGFAQLAGKGPRLPKQTRGDIDKIVQAALHARGLTQQLLFFARRMPQNRARIDLNTVVVEALRLLEPLFDRERIEVVRQLSPSPPVIHADNGQIRQVIVNLAVNAVQAMPKGGTLTIRTVSDQDREVVTLTIEDTGIGMCDEVLSKIFLPFFTTKEADRGTGLGLAVIHGIVTSHGGRIEVHSRQNQGSRFDVFLPCCPVPGLE